MTAPPRREDDEFESMCAHQFANYVMQDAIEFAPARFVPELERRLAQCAGMQQRTPAGGRMRERMRRRAAQPRAPVPTTFLPTASPRKANRKRTTSA